ncbi:MAG: hypothetical protein SVM80_04085 [Halobacteriota archaeon]|nr:hypothetical protein [Halobacteriota archaeon]
MYAQEFMRSVVVALTSIINDLTGAITAFRALGTLTPAKSGNIVSGLINLLIGGRHFPVEITARLFPWIFSLFDRVVSLITTNSTVNTAYHNINLSENLPKIIGPINGTYGPTYLINATINIGVDGANYTGDPTVSIDFMVAMYQAIAAIFDMLGEIGTKIPLMFPWG